MFQAFVYGPQAEFLPPSDIKMTIDRGFLPLSLQSVYGFLCSRELLNLHISLSGSSWRQKPHVCECEHPVLGTRYVGRVLVDDAIRRFFSDKYTPLPVYRATPFLLASEGEVDHDLFQDLLHQGFDEARATRALLLCQNDLSAAFDFLNHGTLPSSVKVDIVNYDQCPLLYLLLEIAEVFLDLPDHCCLCRAELPSGLKPATCDGRLCVMQMTDIGIGTSLCAELRRDPAAADLLLSLFSSAIGTQFLTPRPPHLDDKTMIEILSKLPPMLSLSGCSSDSDLCSVIGSDALGLLRWVVLSNRSYLMSLPPGLKLAEFESSAQFMTLMSSPESEEVFSHLKALYGSMYLWHGSPVDRWHSILRNGLKNATNTSLMRVGAALGPGIYLARGSGTSQGYCQACQNRYAKSALGAQLLCIGLCEVAKVPMGSDQTITVPVRGRRDAVISGFLKDHGWAHTLTLEAACVVRFLLVMPNTAGTNNLVYGQSSGHDVITNPPKNVPTVRGVIEHYAALAHP
jgi:poly [ADP-ribose] polymerase 6/8